MNTAVLNKTYPAPPFCQREILRYAGCKEPTPEISALLDACIGEVCDKLTYNVCYREFAVTLSGNICDFGAFALKSENLATNLHGCDRAVVFAATVGVGIDRLIAKYGRISPTKALLFQALGAERIEALCDTFCADLSKTCDVGLKPRFSAGYGDLPLETQKDIFSVLDCPKRIGLTLTDSLLMSPSKSVTAIVGIGGEQKTQNKCSTCNMKNCTFRGVI